jgi:nitrite reductase/ring-hydroxylating ferredoxin subunit/uncharacterized membrane protein
VASKRSFLVSRIAVPIERSRWLDPLAELLQSGVRAAVPRASPLKELLSGTWLGHPLHPPLTDAVIGCWVSAWLLDVLAPPGSADAADDLIAAGVLASLPTVASGLSDAAELRAGSRRVGLVHGLLNVTTVGLQSASWVLRRRGRRTAGVALSTAGLAVVSASAWLGGHLSFGSGVGVNETAFEELPAEWTKVMADDKLESDKLVRRSVNGTGVLLVRHSADVHALVDRCSHRGCSLSKGKFDGAAITCPCHGSRFGLDGSLLRGPATVDQPVLETRSHEGQIEVRAPR